MYIIIGISLMIFFMIGFGIGLTIPFFVKKYFEMQFSLQEETPIKKVSDEQKTMSINTPAENLSAEVLDEWFNGGGDNK